MKIFGTSAYGVYGAKRRKRCEQSVVHVGADTSNIDLREESQSRGTITGVRIVGLAGNGFLATALLLPFGFKERHPIWGGLFGMGALYNLVKLVGG